MFERSEKVVFMIEGGKALDLVKHHIAERKRVTAEVRALAKELGVESIYTSRDSGVLTGIEFKGPVHPDFKKPDRKGISFPKKGSGWQDRFRSQVGYKNPSYVIADQLGVPLNISYGKSADNHGSRCIGFPFSECGFLYLSADGPYAMWVPDVPAEVAATEADGYTVAEPAKSFRLEFDGCRRIEREEWEILVAQHKLARKACHQGAIMNLTRLTFEFDGHTVSVTGYYDRGYKGSWTEPPEPESFSISTAEITEQADLAEPACIDDLDEEELAAAALRAWHRRDEGERDHYASMRRDEMRLGARI